MGVVDTRAVLEETLRGLNVPFQSPEQARLEQRQRRAAIVTAVLFLIALAFALGWSLGQAAVIAR